MKLPALFLLFASAAGAAPSNTESHPSGCTIHVADPLGPVHLQAASPLEALIELARSRHLCFAFENPGRDLLEPSVDLTLDNASPRSILDRFLQPARPYDITEDQGVISLRPKQKRHAPTLLDIVLPAFNAPPTETLEEASAALNVMLILLRKPKMISPAAASAYGPTTKPSAPSTRRTKPFATYSTSPSPAPTAPPGCPARATVPNSRPASPAGSPRNTATAAPPSRR
jgi:hypothetical protein